MTRISSSLCRLAALLAVALVLAAGPAAAAAADALGRECCHETCPPPEAPPLDAAASCCAQAPAAGLDVVTLPTPPVHDGASIALGTATPAPRAIRPAPSPPHDTGPPAGLRRYLAFSVFRV